MPPRRPKTAVTQPSERIAKAYDHLKVVHPMRPEVGTQPQFKKRKAPKTYRFDSSLSPALDWDSSPAREQGEKLISEILSAKNIEEAKIAALGLKGLSRPFLNWAGKAERISLDVPTLPLFIHERLSTKAIMATIRDRKRDTQMEFDLFADPQHPVTDQILRAYEHQDRWVNRMILGDSLIVMNSLLEYEGMAGKVQMIYMDPPYGVKFGSNFQPFIRKRDVSHNDDTDLTREPEMVQAYRDTWELGVHSYLTYLRERLLISRSLLGSAGSIFVQISDQNLHHVRELMDEVFGAENFVGQIPFVTTSSQTSETLGSVADYLLWYAKDRARIKYHQLYVSKDPRATGGWGFNYIEEPNGKRRPLTREERTGEVALPAGRIYGLDNLTSQGTTPSGTVEFEFNGKKYHPGPRNHWKTTLDGMRTLAKARRIQESSNQIRYVRFFDDFPVQALSNLWTDTTQAGFVNEKIYVVQTIAKVVERCLLMTTDPGDLVLDPTCGSGTTAYMAEAWGRRWITIDTSRVPLTLARQRLLTASYPYYQLKDDSAGPSAGFVYLRKQNKAGREIGGVVPHITLGSIANNEKAEEEVLVDRPERLSDITRVTGPFVVEATIPVPIDGEAYQSDDARIQGEEPTTFVDKMLEVLRRNPILRIDSKHEIKLKDVRRPTRTLSLSAEALAQNGKDRSVAFVFGPENGSISESLIFSAAKEAHAKDYSQLT